MIWSHRNNLKEDPETQSLISISDDVDGYLIDHTKIEDIVSNTCKLLHIEHLMIDLSFVTVDKIQQLNQKYRSKDSPTDVLSFPQIEWNEPLTLEENTRTKDHQGTLGDIVVCPYIGENNAKSLEQGIDKEISFLIVHSILHLCGHDHQKQPETQRMIDLQSHIVNALDTPPIWKDCIKKREDTHVSN